MTSAHVYPTKTEISGHLASEFYCANLPLPQTKFSKLLLKIYYDLFNFLFACSR